MSGWSLSPSSTGYLTSLDARRDCLGAQAHRCRCEIARKLGRRAVLEVMAKAKTATSADSARSRASSTASRGTPTTRHPATPDPDEPSPHHPVSKQASRTQNSRHAESDPASSHTKIN